MVEILFVKKNQGDLRNPSGVVTERRHVLIIPAYGKNGHLVDTNKFPPNNRISIEGFSDEQERQALEDTTQTWPPNGKVK